LRETQHFDDRSEISTAPNGTVSTKRSLIVQSGRQAAQDASATAAETGKAVRDLLKRR
jgi:conjugal transfer mating pair stabilization protein TraG